MAPPVFPEIDSSGVAAMCFAYGTSKTGFGLRNSDQVDMVRHKAPSPNLDPVFTTPLPHQFDISEIIVVTKKTGCRRFPRWVTWRGTPGHITLAILAMEKR